MRVLAPLAALALIVPLVAQALPAAAAEITVTIGPKLQAKAGDYGQRDLDLLAKELRADLERALAAKGQTRGRLDVVITDATPNRPTFAQMGRNPSLSMRSVGVGGASIKGVEHGPGGERSWSYSFWETDIRNERGSATWSDAEQAFDTFARNYANGRR
jgi:hypothetical protein